MPSELMLTNPVAVNGSVRRFAGPWRALSAGTSLAEKGGLRRGRLNELKQVVRPIWPASLHQTP